MKDEDTDWETLPSDDPATNNMTEGKLNQLLVQQALKKLDTEKKQVLVLSRYEGFRYREIAKIVGITENAVKVRVFRALKDLKNIITDLEKQHNYEK